MREKLKQKMALLLALGLLLTGCSAGQEQKAPAQTQPVEQQEPQLPEEELWREKYIDFLSELCRQEAAVRKIDRPDYDPNVYPAEIGGLSDAYMLYDVDKDGVPELLLHYGKSEAARRTEVYTVRAGDMVLAGEFPSGHAAFYSCPEENGVLYNWGHMGGHVVEKISLTENSLSRETVLEETWSDPETDYTAVEALVSGSRPLLGARTTLGLTFGEEASSAADQPLTLPIAEYGRERVPAAPDPDAERAAKDAITAVLEREGTFCGVSADGFGGETGPVTLKEYVLPGGATAYADSPLEVSEIRWLDLNEDGQTDALATLRHEEGDSFDGVLRTIFSLEEDGQVYGYCLNYMDGCTLDGTVFRGEREGDAFQVSFDGNQCYFKAAE